MLHLSLRSIFEEKESQVRYASFSVSGNTAILAYLYGNAIKTKVFENPAKLAQYLKCLKIIKGFKVVENGQVELHKDYLETIEYGKNGRPIQNPIPVKVNWDEVKISDEAATSLAAYEEVPVKGFDFSNYIKRTTKVGFLALRF